MRIALLLACLMSAAFAADPTPSPSTSSIPSTSASPSTSSIPSTSASPSTSSSPSAAPTEATSASPAGRGAPDKLHAHPSLLKDGAKQGLDVKQEGGESVEEEYRQLSGEEVRALLLRVVEENIDKDGDGLVGVEELRDWLRVLQEKVIRDNVERQWDYYGPQSAEETLSWDAYYPERKAVVSWERYLNYTYPDDALRGDADTAEVREVRELVRRAERRWKNADADGDGGLSKDEFRDFIHPEESQRAGGVAVLEALEDMDLDRDGLVSLQEYMDHLQKVSGDEKEDPQWAEAQRGHFAAFLDKDKDGNLDSTEMREWVVPSYDRSEAEAWRLVSLADADQDTRLTRHDIDQYHEYFLSLLPPEYWVQEDPAESSKHDEF